MEMELSTSQQPTRRATALAFFWAMVTAHSARLPATAQLHFRRFLQLLISTVTGGPISLWSMRRATT